MGYSARYHAASLAAVFLALAIGILIGSAFGDDVVSGTADSREREFGRGAYPALVGDRLSGAQVGLIGLGGLPEELGADVRAALDPTGAELSSVAVVREPVDTQGLASAAGLGRSQIPDDPETLEAYARTVGRQIVTGGSLLERTQDELFSRVSGRLGELDAVVVSRPQELDLDRLETGLLAGMAASPATVIGVERTDAGTSSIGVFGAQRLATVDHVDLVAGQVALILTLLGADGDYGVKDSADQLLPDVLIGPTSFLGGP